MRWPNAVYPLIVNGRGCPPESRFFDYGKARREKGSLDWCHEDQKEAYTEDNRYCNR